jgi:hypothetical protein
MLQETNQFIIGTSTQLGGQMMNMSQCLKLRTDMVAVNLQPYILYFIACNMFTTMMFLLWSYTKLDIKYLKILMYVNAILSVIFMIQIIL